MFTPCPAAGGDLDLATLRACAIADAHARFAGAGGAGATLGCGLDSGVEREPLAALEIGFDWDATPAADDAAVRRWARWLIGRLDAAGSIYQRGGEEWRLRTGKLHEESERRLGELAGWSEAALDGQRKLLEHVDDPGDDGTDLEQSLSKLAAAGWSVDSKKDKKAPAVHFAAGDLPLATGADWRADGAVHPRLAAALAFFAGALPDGALPDGARADGARADGALPDGAPDGALPDGEEPPVAALAGRLPALAVAGRDDAAALLDIRTVAKALRDVGGLELPDGEPLGQVLQPGPFRLRASGTPAATGGADPAAGSNGAAPAPLDPNDGAAPAPLDPNDAAAPAPLDPNDAAALIAARGGEPVRFALLHAAAPEKKFRGGDDVVGYAAAFVTAARELAGARLDGAAVGERIDTGDALRRRLAGWCDIAAARSAENHERREPHRATRNAIALLTRIRDFDAAVAARDGDVAGADREAVGVALTVLARLLAPLAPAASAELWTRAGLPGSPSAAAWPRPQREHATAA